MAELEYGLFRVPYEHFQKLARNNHKVIQKHLQTSLIQAELIQTARSVSPEDGGPPIGEDVEIAGMSLVGKAEVLKSVQIMIQELEQLKKRLNGSAQVASNGVSRLRARVCHLYQLESATEAAKEAAKEGKNSGARSIEPAAEYDEEEEDGGDVRMKVGSSDEETSCSDTEMEDDDNASPGESDRSSAAEISDPKNRRAAPSSSGGPMKKPKRRRIGSAEMTQSAEAASASGSASASSDSSAGGPSAECNGRGAECPVHCQPLVPVNGAGSTHSLYNVTRLRFNRVLADHLMREGMYATAVELASQSNISKLVDLDVHVTAKRIVESLDQRDCSRALQWCSANRVHLNRIGSSLEFQLHVQVFLELLVEGKTVEAVQYSQEYLSPFADQHLEEIQKVMMLMAFPELIQQQLQQQQRRNGSSSAPSGSSAAPPNHASPQLQNGGSSRRRSRNRSQRRSILSAETHPDYAKYFDGSRWNFLKKQFKKDHAAISGLTAHSLLSISLQTGLSALKTSFCDQPGHRRRNCPGCSSTFREITQSVPIAQRQQSCLVCRLSGEVMDENNPPLVLPNGELYSRRALTRIADSQDGLLFLQEDGSKVYLEDCRPAYIL